MKTVYSVKKYDQLIFYFVFSNIVILSDKSREKTFVFIYFLFVLNSVLEINKNKNLMSHLMFVDLKEACGRVDQGILKLAAKAKAVKCAENLHKLSNKPLLPR